LLELLLLELLLALELELFFDPDELLDLVGMTFSPFRRVRTDEGGKPFRCSDLGEDSGSSTLSMFYSCSP
jgi:hypothetical protein